MVGAELCHLFFTNAKSFQISGHVFAKLWHKPFKMDETEYQALSQMLPLFKGQVGTVHSFSPGVGEGWKTRNLRGIAISSEARTAARMV